MSSRSGGPAVALIGAGLAGERHARAWHAISNTARLVAVADPHPDAGRRVSELTGARYYEDHEALLAAEQLDAVDICVPPHLHVPLVTAAASAGLHILCEKPIAPTLDDARALAEAVSAAGVTYMAAHNTLFLPTVQRAAALIEQGDLGRVYTIRSLDCFEGAWTAPTRWAVEEAALPAFFAPGAWRTRSEQLHGGALVDAGCHAVYRLLRLAPGRPVSVQALTRNFNDDLDWHAEDSAIALVEFDDGVVGELIVSHAFGPPTTGGETLFHAVGREGFLGASETTLHVRPAGWSTAATHQLWAIEGREAIWLATLEAELRRLPGDGRRANRGHPRGHAGARGDPRRLPVCRGGTQDRAAARAARGTAPGPV